MKNKTANPLPKTMPGSVHQQYVRCGKATCKCARGELHGAYYYYFVRTAGTLTKRYLKAHEVEQVRVACLAWREEEKARRAKSRETWQILREINARLRDAVKQIKTSVGG
ncbi:MAG: hypothetical protein M3R15_30680 [Acidobacteriota bacterium]|nr:hypothetical protein [Acidobacteriota bacterium]